MRRLKKYVFLLLILSAAFCCHAFVLDFSHYFYKYNNSRVSKSLLLNVSDYNAKEYHMTGANLVVRYMDCDSQYIGLIERMVTIYYPVLAKTFELNEVTALTVILYPDVKAMNEALHLQSNEFVIGCYYGGVLNILSPAAFLYKNAESDALDAYLDDGPLIHELTHLVVDKKTNGNCPLFFSEGLALYMEHKYTGFVLNGDFDFVPAEDLMNRFREIDVSASYARSLAIVNTIAELGGETKIIGILESLSKGLSFQEAFEKTLGFDFMFIDKM